MIVLILIAWGFLSVGLAGMWASFGAYRNGAHTAEVAILSIVSVVMLYGAGWIGWHMHTLA